MSHPKPSEKRKGLGAGIIAFGVVFALFSLLFRPHTVGAFALATALSLFAGAVIRVMAQGLDVPIQIDGGVNTETIAEAARAGVSICVAGTGVFKTPDAAEAIRALRESARAALG